MHAAKLSYALMTLLPLHACQLGLSLLSGKPGSSHVDDQSHAQLMLLQSFHAVFNLVRLPRLSVELRCSGHFLSHSSSALQQ